MEAIAHAVGAFSTGTVHGQAMRGTRSNAHPTIQFTHRYRGASQKFLLTGTSIGPTVLAPTKFFFRAGGADLLIFLVFLNKIWL